MVGIPLAVDNLTASKSRITFARICVQVNPSSPLPDSVTLNLKGRKVIQEIIYDWKPTACSTCSSFSHGIENCPKSGPKEVPLRGRSRSRPPSKSVKQNTTQGKVRPPVSAVPTPPISLPPPSPGSSNSEPLTDLNLFPIPSPPPECPPPEPSSANLPVDEQDGSAEEPMYSIVTRSSVAAPAKGIAAIPQTSSPPKGNPESDPTVPSQGSIIGTKTKRKGKAALSS